MYPCGCGSGFPLYYHASQLGHVVRCPHIGREMHVIGSTFGAPEWETTNRLDHLEACADLFKLTLSPRKQRLAVCHWVRGHLNQKSDKWDWEALAAGEMWAESETRPVGVEDLLRRREGRDGRWHPDVCIADTPRLPGGDEHTHRVMSASNVYRDVSPNPFVPLEWQPEWLTSTVRDLATHIYAERDFATMPILGDALMDAGCDHQLIQEHCHSTKPHARGCWVVDAILGKS